jgi:formate hydrogenlyase subunit 6/NADH:ubiquinone oxidoreductase subunit I
MRLTMRHLLSARKRRKVQDIRQADYFKDSSGISTMLYPFESVQLPETGRYLLHNEIEDCIVCDKCVKVCPVNCIDIEPIRSPVEFGKTSDGKSRRIYAAKFDIDMAKCCFCGLCTTVCPTECLIMTPEYDAPVLNLEKLNFGFGNLSEAEAEQRRKEWEEDKAKKEALKAAKSTEAPADNPSAAKPASPGPAFSPFRMPAPKKNDSN